LGTGALVYGERLWIEGLLSKIEYFEVGDNVVIRGCHVTTPADIRELAAVRYHTNLFSVNPGRLEAILDKHPWVKTASIHRDWPNRLVIDIVEYVPEVLAVLGKPGHQRLYYMDAQGVPFIAVKPGQDLDYPVITGMEDIRSADKRRQALHEAMQFIRLVKRNNPNLPAQSVSEIHLDATEGMVVYLVEYPFPIYFGQGDVAKKCRRLEDVLGALYKHRKDGTLISQVEYIKMNYLENKVLVAHSSSS
jgi:cell division protein FtsQ